MTHHSNPYEPLLREITRKSEAEALPPVAGSAVLWSVLYNTKQGAIHPLRLRFRDPVDARAANDAAMDYFDQHGDWLSSIEDVYPSPPALHKSPTQ